MAKQQGKIWRVYMVADDDSKTVLAFEKTSSFEVNNSLVDDSDKDSGNYESFIDGKRSWSDSVTLNYDQSDVQVQAIIDDMIASDGDTKRKIFLGNDTVVGDIGFESFARIESISLPAPDGELMTIDVSFKGVAPITKIVKA